MAPILRLLPVALLLACSDKDGSTEDDDGGGGGPGGVDADGDGYFAMPEGDDCDDGDPAINPFAAELCDGIDNDCDTVVDEDSAEDARVWYLDDDEDGYGDPEESDRACEAPDEGGPWITTGGDCDDSDDQVFPGAEEVCNGVDDDCDDDTDEADAADATTWFLDEDGDGFGTDASAEVACAPDGEGSWVEQGGDCDDGDDAVHPEATEVCNDVDDDCDGAVDDADDDVDETSWLTYYRDGDSDGYGNASAPALSCSSPEGHVADGTDCNDGDPAIHPGAVEVCDEADTDEDCSGLADDDDPDVAAAGLSTWVPDADRDGYGGDSATPVFACDDPSVGPTAYVLADTSDCDDGDAAIHPGADEVCDDADTDEDCDGLVDDGDDSTLPSSMSGWYADSDGDGYGAGTAVPACEDPSGPGAPYVDNDADCDDGDPAISPDATEVCDDADTDEDCDGLVDDEDIVDPDSGTRYYADTDRDGYGDPDNTFDACEPPGREWVTDDSDCDDSDPDVYPGAPEVCDAIDQDCDPDTEGTTGASFTSTTGTVTMLTATFAAGSPSSPVAWSSSAAGTLVFCGGTTYTNLTITHDVAVRGTEGATLNGAGVLPVVTLTGSTVDAVLEDLVLTGGDGEDATTGSLSDGGGGIDCYDVASLQLDRVTVTDNESGYGAGMLLNQCDTTATDIEVSDNYNLGGFGAGIMVWNGDLVLVDSQVDDQAGRPYYGGGLYIGGNSSSLAPTVTLDGTSVSGNQSYYGGGGIALVYGSLSCVDGTIAENENYYDDSTYSGGGVYVGNSSINSLTSDGCDWGSGTRNNDPNDIFLRATGYEYSVPTSGDVTCTYTSCR